MAEDKKKENKSLYDLLGMKFSKEGSWIAKDTGNSPIMRKLNHKERRIQKAMERKEKKKMKGKN